MKSSWGCVGWNKTLERYELSWNITWRAYNKECKFNLCLPEKTSKTEGRKLSQGFILKCGRCLFEAVLFGTVHLSVGNQKPDNPLSDYCEGDYMLTLRCYVSIDSGKYQNMGSLTRLCEYEPGNLQLITDVAIGRLFKLSASVKMLSIVSSTQ